MGSTMTRPSAFNFRLERWYLVFVLCACVVLTAMAEAYHFMGITVARVAGQELGPLML
jgi:hypothetical protein